MGQGLLLTSNPQGSDALLELYIVRRSTDAGKTWQAVPGTEQNCDSPQELVRLAGGRILGPSGWTHVQPDGTLTGKTTILLSGNTTPSAHSHLKVNVREGRPGMKADTAKLKHLG